MNDHGWTFMGGLVVGMFLYMCASAWVDPTFDLITECEKNLPRNQECVLTAEPGPTTTSEGGE